MPSPRDPATLVRAARLYYLEGKSQSEVAEAIGVSRSSVSRVLTEARRIGIVEIRVNDPSGRDADLEEALVRRYGLRDARVLSTFGAQGGSQLGSDVDLATERVGRLGAQWLQDNLPVSGGIALSWGSAVQAVVAAMPEEPVHEELSILPLVGGVSAVESTSEGNLLIYLLARKLGARSLRLHAPAVVGSRETRDALLREPEIQQAFAESRDARVALVGLGRAGSGASKMIIDSMRLTPDELQAFQDTGAVGDCCTRFYDIDGNSVESVVDERVLSIDLESLAAIPTVVGVAAGAHKAPAAHGALVGGLIDVFIADEPLVRALLAQADRLDQTR